MVPNALLLRKFRGIRDGMGLDELSLDFSVLPNGTVVFVGENGKGKTTILDNMHPFRIMPSKVKTYSTGAFSYYDECYGEDACKDLYWTGNDGLRYRSLVNINAEKKKQEAYLYRIEENGSQVSLNHDGKTGSYDTALEMVLGKPDLYFISDFRAQNAKYMSDYTNGDIKEVLSEFLGIEYIRLLSKTAREIVSELTGTLKGVFELRQDLTGKMSQRDAREAELNVLHEKVLAVEEMFDTKEKEKTMLEETLAEIRSREALQGSLATKKLELSDEVRRKEAIARKIQAEGDGRIQVLSRKIQTMSEKIHSTKRIVTSVCEKRVRIGELRYSEARKGELQNAELRQENELAEVHKKLKEIAEAEQSLSEKEKAVSDCIHRAELKALSIRSEQKRMEKETERLSGVPCKDTPLAQTCKFVKDAVEAASQLPGKIEELQRHIQKSEEEKRLLQNDLLPLMEACRDKHDLEEKETGLLQKLDATRTSLFKCETALAEAAKLEKEIFEALAAEKNLPELEQRFAELEAEKQSEETRLSRDVETLAGEITEVYDKMKAIVIDDTLASQRKALEGELVAFGESMNELRMQEKALTKEVGALEVEVNAYPALQGQLATVEKRAEYLGKEVTEWTILAKALGDEGIIALEIDDAGPAISQLANELLREVYGNRFTVRIDTQERTGKKLKEEFDITVFDSRSNTIKSIKKMSGGEKELLEDIIPKAVGLFNKGRTGIGSSTLFTDERDGALDSVKKRSFFLMKNKVLELGGYRQEFCITHTPELIKMANGVIELSDGAVTMYTN